MDLETRTTVQYRLLPRSSNLKSHVRWFRYLCSDNFRQDWQTRSHSQIQRRAQVNIAREVVESDIYSISQGEGNIWRSFKCDTKEGVIGNTLYSDPSVAPSKAGKNPGRYSYAAFFEKPETYNFNSFIKSPSGNEHDSIRYRPFFWHMTKRIFDNEKIVSPSLMMKTIQRRMPQRQG